MDIIRLGTAAASGATMLFALACAGEAAEVKAIVANPMKAVVEEIGAQFERDTGHKLVTRFVSGPVVKREIDAGEAADLAISAAPVIDALIKEGKIAGATHADVAYTSVGVGVRAGAPKPDLGSVDAFKRTLLSAKSVAHSAEGPSGVYFKGLLDRLGIAEDMKPKLKPMSGDALVKAVPSGEAEMIVSSMPDLIAEGTVLAGALPRELQSYIRFAAGIGSNAKEADAARVLIKFLTAPAAIPVIRAKGMEPGTPR
jgi:molybdate transport system substrate-binding protein